MVDRGDAFLAWLAVVVSHRPSDFLMFSPAIYDGLHGDWNAAAWPLAVGSALTAGVVLIQARRGRLAGVVLMLATLAVLWVAVGLGFHGARWSNVFIAAPVYAGIFIGQGLLLAGVAIDAAVRLHRGRAPWHWVDSIPRRSVALGLALSALVLHPLATVASGRPWSQTEWLGLAPEPTALATLAAWLVLQPPPGRGPSALVRGLAIVPALWGLLAALTLHTMERPGAATWVAACTLLSLAGAVATRPGRVAPRPQAPAR